MAKITVDTTQARNCAKCASAQPPLFRHHKGCDGKLGFYNKKILGDYPKFLDCVLLCFECHLTIHWIYERYFRDWINRTPSGTWTMRERLIGICDRWLRGEIKTPKTPKYYRERFAHDLDAWQESQKAVNE